MTFLLFAGPFPSLANRFGLRRSHPSPIEKTNPQSVSFSFTARNCALQNCMGGCALVFRKRRQPRASVESPESQAARGIARLLAWAENASPPIGCSPATHGIRRVIWSPPRFSGTPVSRPPNAPVLSTGASIPTLCATALPRICSKPVPTCVPTGNHLPGLPSQISA